MSEATYGIAPRGRLAILHPPGRMGLGANPFGKDVANLQLWQALARHGGYERLDVLSAQPADLAELKAALFEDRAPTTEIATALLSQSRAPEEAGVLLRGQPELYDLAWMRRRRASDRAYSLVGLIHTLGPPAMRQIIAMTSAGPMHPWDALICTSPSVRDNLAVMFAGWGEHLAERTGGRPPPQPALPVIPLGVDGPAFAALADRPDARARVRATFGLAKDDVLVLWVGRLSYYEKAFPQPMFQAVQQARARTGAKVVFAMAGWFPSEPDRGHYEAAARAHAPDVDVRFVDGNDRALLGDLWAAGDIFLSLVDNIQETFGITPLEAMAAGLPVVASD
ncbi:glycosyltransferase family 4 protein [Phenylobacterium sp.]|uniref:glycosyltransferase family 4 protein n=1 Tax=Phenylobacterium sp. TaxID=1871053 RepID=UPI003D2956FF